MIDLVQYRFRIGTYTGMGAKGSGRLNRACLITLHSNFEIFQKGHPAVAFMIDRRIFER